MRDGKGGKENIRENYEGFCCRQWWGVYFTGIPSKGIERYPELSILMAEAGVSIHSFLFFTLTEVFKTREKHLHALEVGHRYHKCIRVGDRIRSGPGGCNVGHQESVPH